VQEEQYARELAEWDKKIAERTNELVGAVCVVVVCEGAASGRGCVRSAQSASEGLREQGEDTKQVRPCCPSALSVLIAACIHRRGAHTC